MKWPIQSRVKTLGPLMVVLLEITVLSLEGGVLLEETVTEDGL